MSLPIADHCGEVKIGNVELPCAVLPDGTRLITQKGIFQAIGRTGQSSGQFSSSGVRGLSLPVFLRAQNLKPFITNELIEASAPIKFKVRTPVGRLNDALGFKAEILPLTCQVFIEAFNAGVLSNRQVHIAEKCRSLAKGFAIVGITALIDEATGYQEIRDRKALQEILDRYLRKDFAAWAKRFPDEFYQQIFRLRGWQWKGMKVNRPSAVAGYTKDLVYARLAPGVLEELEKLNPIEEGHRRVKHHQYLTVDVGHPALQAHLQGVMALMRASTTWDGAKRMVQRAFPKINTNLDLPFPDDQEAN
jgi:P63C domain